MCAMSFLLILLKNNFFSINDTRGTIDVLTDRSSSSLSSTNFSCHTFCLIGINFNVNNDDKIYWLSLN